jgi:hypothetical protein
MSELQKMLLMLERAGFCEGINTKTADLLLGLEET